MGIQFQLKSGETLAQAYARDRSIFPTDMSSAELRDLDAAAKRQSVFSARTTNAQYAQTIADITDKLLAGDINEATGRAMLQDMADLLGYDPAKGFPGDNPERIPTAEVGSLRDLSSEPRTKLVLDTQESMAANYAYTRSGQTDEARWQFPCWELVRIFTRKHERDDWQRRWVAAGGQIYNGRMICRKDSEVLQNLGDGAGGYTDTLGNPYAPFAFQSGMGLREVPRQECIDLGVIAPDEMPEIADPGFAEELKINREAFSPDILAALEADLAA